MNFVEWYKKTFQEDWEMDYATVYGFASGVFDEYEKYCERNNVKPDLCENNW